MRRQRCGQCLAGGLHVCCCERLCYASRFSFALAAPPPAAWTPAPDMICVANYRLCISALVLLLYLCISALVFLRTHACILLSNSQCGCAGMSAWSAVRGRLGTGGCVIPAVGGQITCASLWVGVRFFTFSLSLVAKVSRYNHQDTAL